MMLVMIKLADAVLMLQHSYIQTDKLPVTKSGSTLSSSGSQLKHFDHNNKNNLTMSWQE